MLLTMLRGAGGPSSSDTKARRMDAEVSRARDYEPGSAGNAGAGLVTWGAPRSGG